MLPIKESIASATVTIDRADQMKTNFGNHTEYFFPVKLFKEFLVEIKNEKLPTYITGLGANMGKELSGNKFNIGLSVVFYTGNGGKITGYRTLENNFFGRLSSDFSIPVTDKKTYKRYTEEPDKLLPNDPFKKPATVAVIEIASLENLISEITYSNTDFASFEFARMDDGRLTVLFSLKRKFGKIYTLLQPGGTPEFAYLDVHDLIPPPDKED